MFEMRLDKVVEQIVSTTFAQGRREKEALYFNFDLRLWSFEKQEQFYTSRGLHLLYHQQSYSSYISVFSAISPSPFGRMKDIAEWKHESTHDSCWRDIRGLTDLYFDMANEINA